MKIALLILMLTGFSLIRDGFISSDEAVNLQMVKNMQEDPVRFTVRPSYDPGGHEDWERDSLSHILMTPVFHYIIYLGSFLLPLELSKFSFLVQATILILLILFSMSFISKYDKADSNNLPEIFMLSLLPIFMFLQVEHEGMMTCFGFISLFLALSGLKDSKTIHFALSGFFLGLAFLIKLWLIAPFVLGLIAILIYTIFRKDFSIVQLLKYSMVLIISFGLTSSVHAFFVMLNSPQDIYAWLNHVYFGVITGAGDYGKKALGEGGWAQPFYYYVYALTRDLLPVFPLLLAVLWSITKNAKNLLISKLDIGLFGILLGVIILSFNGTKEPLYILPAYFAVLLFLSKNILNLRLSRIEYKKISMVNILFLLTFFGAIFNFNLSKSVNLNFMTFVIVSNIGALTFLFYTSRLSKKMPLSLSFLFFFTPLFYTYTKVDRSHFDVVNFIQSRELEEREPTTTFVVGEEYSKLGYSLGTRVKKLRWLIGKNNLQTEDVNKLVRQKALKYFIFHLDDPNGVFFAKRVRELGFESKRLSSYFIVYR